MKKFALKLCSLILILGLAVSMSGCMTTMATLMKDDEEEIEETEGTTADFFGDVSDDDDDEPEETGESEETEESDETESTGETTANTDIAGSIVTGDNGLTYPDHVATADEIHPEHANGTVTGQEAKDLLAEVETEILNEACSDYVDAVLLFEDPEAMGIEVPEVGWGDYDVEDDPSDYTKYLDRLYTIDRDSLDDSDGLCYDKLVYDLEEGLYSSYFTAFPYYVMCFNPLVGPQNDVLFILEVIEFTDKEDAENYLLVLEDIDRYYDEICEFEEQRAEYGYASSPDIYEESAASFDALVAQTDDCFLYESFETRLDAIDGLSDEDRADLISRHEKVMKEVVFPEFEECAQRMRALKSYNGSDKGLSSYDGGAAYYEWLFRKQTNSDRGTETSTQQLETVLNNIGQTYASLAQSSDMTWIYDYYLHDYTAGSVDQNLQFLYKAIANDFPEIAEHSYRLMEVPEVFEDSFSPAAYLGYHLEDFNSNLIITNNGSLGTDLGITVAHEGYPGHMFQSIYTRMVTDHPYMYINDSVGYSEGWAVYAETFSINYYEDNATVGTIVQIEDEWNTLLTARCDIGIHCEEWTVQDCADFFSESLGYEVSASDLQTYYNLLLSDPCYSAKYGIGFVNTGLTIQAAIDKYPDKSYKEIHTAYLNAQTGTFEQIEEHMMAELAGN